MISVSIIQHYCDNRLEFYHEQQFSLPSQKDMYMETERNCLRTLKMYRINNQLHRQLIPQEGELEKYWVAVAVLQRAQAYHGCKMATQLKNTFRVFKSCSRKSTSGVQGFYVWSSAKIIHIRMECRLEPCREIRIYKVCGKKR